MFLKASFLKHMLLKNRFSRARLLKASFLKASFSKARFSPGNGLWLYKEIERCDKRTKDTSIMNKLENITTMLSTGETKRGDDLSPFSMAVYDIHIALVCILFRFGNDPNAFRHFVVVALCTHVLASQRDYYVFVEYVTLCMIFVVIFNDVGVLTVLENYTALLFGELHDFVVWRITQLCCWRITQPCSLENYAALLFG